MLIKNITAKEIKDSRSNPTLEVSVITENHQASFSVPSGASTGLSEAFELRDADKKGVKTAIEKIHNIIAPELVGKNVFNQQEIDELLIQLDGTDNKQNLGGNSLIGVSIACAKVAAAEKDIPIFEYLKTLADIKPSRPTPLLFMNLINGGKHGNPKLSFQEFHIVPMTDSPKEAVEVGVAIQTALREILTSEYGSESLKLGAEGGFSPDKLSSTEKSLKLLNQAVEMTKPSFDIKLALDVAASSFYENKKYLVDERSLSSEELLSFYGKLLEQFSIFSIEDPFYEKDFGSFGKLLNQYPNLLVMGDDLTTTNPKLLKKAIKEKSINAIIIKPNQIGTLTETLETMKLARENNIECIVSHRSGETMDDFIADLAYAFGCYGLKSGAPLKEERIVKYNRLIEIVKNNTKI